MRCARSRAPPLQSDYRGIIKQALASRPHGIYGCDSSLTIKMNPELTRSSETISPCFLWIPGLRRENEERSGSQHRGFEIAFLLSQYLLLDSGYFWSSVDNADIEIDFKLTFAPLIACWAFCVIIKFEGSRILFVGRFLLKTNISSKLFPIIAVISGIAEIPLPWFFIFGFNTQKWRELATDGSTL